MRSLQIRHLPDEIYEALAHRAEREGRSLAQQAIRELRKVPELEARGQRLEVVRRLRNEIRRDTRHRVNVDPAELLREDREG